jgi:hypothetical protein
MIELVPRVDVGLDTFEVDLRCWSHRLFFADGVYELLVFQTSDESVEFFMSNGLLNEEISEIDNEGLSWVGLMVRRGRMRSARKEGCARSRTSELHRGVLRVSLRLKTRKQENDER